MRHHRNFHRLSDSNSATNMFSQPPPTPTYLRSNSYNNNPQPFSTHQMIRLDNHSSSYDHKSHTALAVQQKPKVAVGISSLIGSLLSFITIPSFTIVPATCRWLTSSIVSSASSALSVITKHPTCSKVVTGTLFGHRKGHAFLTIQEHPRSDPILILDLPMSTSALVKEMSSGLVRIALECDRKEAAGKKKRASKELLLNEVEWSMYCNSRKCGAARSTEGSRDFAAFVLGTVGSISVGAGVIPVVSDGKTYDLGELMYMRARFERVVGNCHSEAFYMLNPEGHAGGPELSIFMLRL